MNDTPSCSFPIRNHGKVDDGALRLAAGTIAQAWCDATGRSRRKGVDRYGGIDQAKDRDDALDWILAMRPAFVFYCGVTGRRAEKVRDRLLEWLWERKEAMTFTDTERRLLRAAYMGMNRSAFDCNQKAVRRLAELTGYDVLDLTAELVRMRGSDQEFDAAWKEMDARYDTEDFGDDGWKVVELKEEFRDLGERHVELEKRYRLLQGRHEKLCRKMARMEKAIVPEQMTTETVHAWKAGKSKIKPGGEL